MPVPRLPGLAQALRDRVAGAVADLEQALARRAAAAGEAVAAVLARELDAELLEPVDRARRLAGEHLDEARGRRSRARSARRPRRAARASRRRRTRPGCRPAPSRSCSPAASPSSRARPARRRARRRRRRRARRRRCRSRARRSLGRRVHGSTIPEISSSYELFTDRVGNCVGRGFAPPRHQIARSSSWISSGVAGRGFAWFPARRRQLLPHRADPARERRSRAGARSRRAARAHASLLDRVAADRLAEARDRVRHDLAVEARAPAAGRARSSRHAGGRRCRRAPAPSRARARGPASRARGRPCAAPRKQLGPRVAVAAVREHARQRAARSAARPRARARPPSRCARAVQRLGAVGESVQRGADGHGTRQVEREVDVVDDPRPDSRRRRRRASGGRVSGCRRTSSTRHPSTSSARGRPACRSAR